ncbi:MAG: class I SAM-dependent methyltransferase [Spirochaetales bacterium]|nr:class I SAM-dependent methyltransferase [Spirochaetales bacterium]
MKYRPGYPDEIIAYLEQNAVLKKNRVIADIGSGTGKLAKLFIGYGYKVFTVEPHVEMRQAAEILFKGNKNIVSLNGSAESIPLEDGSVDAILFGQVFHRFEAETDNYNSMIKKYRQLFNNYAIENKGEL